MWRADGYFSLLLCRLASRCRAFRIPILPSILRRLSIIFGQVHIGAPVVLEPGIILPHGQVVIDGITTIGSGTIIRPFCTIGLIEGEYLGPTIGKNVVIGTGAKVLGPIKIGNGAVIGANAVVIKSVAPRRTVVGIPAKELDR